MSTQIIDNIFNSLLLRKINIKTIKDLKCHSFVGSDIQLNCAKECVVKSILNSNQTNESEDPNQQAKLDLGVLITHDLVPNKYEGGFKVWEGTSDMIEYLNGNNILDQYKNGDESKQIKILDIGCGSGLIGIYCLKILPSAQVYFQDFNRQVLECFTAVNVLLNCPDEDESQAMQLSNCKFVCGDWTSVADELISQQLDHKYHLLLGSEIIYNVDNYEKLLKLITTALAKDGIMFLASKSYYFGVGGGTCSFQEFIDNDGQLICQVCHDIDAPLTRQILKIQWKESA